MCSHQIQSEFDICTHTSASGNIGVRPPSVYLPYNFIAALHIKYMLISISNRVECACLFIHCVQIRANRNFDFTEINNLPFNMLFGHFISAASIGYL